MDIRSLWITGILGVSGISTLLGISYLFAFNQTAGAVSKTPALWPSSSSIHVRAARSMLLVFVHPYCSCSTATVAELTQVTALQNRPVTTVLFYRPKNSHWKAGSLWEKVSRELIGANMVWDDEGREARRFGALTSGYTLFYNEKGKLLFSGGVTGSRGHEGDNLGLDRLRAAIETGQPSLRTGLVFGCALAGASAGSEGGLL